MVSIITLKNKEEWESIVGKNCEVYDMWQYVSAFEKNDDGEATLIYKKYKNGLIYNIVFKRNISEIPEFRNDKNWFDFISPYGYAGVKVNGKITNENLKDFFKEYSEYCKNNNVISEFIRLNPLQENEKNYIFDKSFNIIYNSKTVFIKLESQEQIWNDLKSTCRNRIRKAQNNGIIIKSGFSDKMFEEFLNIYRETMNRDNAKDYYYFNEDFFNDIKLNMNNNATIVTAYLNDTAIDSVLIIYNGDNAHYHLGGTLNNYMDLGAHNYVLYEASLLSLNKGFKKFHLGGGYGGDNSPLLRFKKNFNKNGELDFYIGKKIYNQEKYDELVNIKESIKGSKIEDNFFPKYRSD